MEAYGINLNLTVGRRCISWIKLPGLSDISTLHHLTVVTQVLVAMVSGKWNFNIFLKKKKIVLGAVHKMVHFQMAPGH